MAATTGDEATNSSIDSAQSSPASATSEVFQEAKESDAASLLPPSDASLHRSSTHSSNSSETEHPDFESTSRQSSLTSAGEESEDIAKRLSTDNASDLQDVALDTESNLTTSRPTSSISISDQRLSRTLSKSPNLTPLNEGFETRSFEDRSPSLAANQWRNSMPTSPALTQTDDHGEGPSTLAPYKRRTVASMSSISTGGNDNFDFLIQRLDLKDQEAKDSKHARRRSLAQLKEGFDRIQEELGATDEIE